MIVLLAISTAQNIDVYVREHTGSTYTITVIDETLNSESTSTVSGTATDGILNIDITYNFIEGRYYMLKIFDSSSNLLTFQKIYCSDQSDFDKFSVLEGYYTQPTKAETNYIVKQWKT